MNRTLGPYIQPHPTVGDRPLWVQWQIRTHLRVNRKAMHRCEAAGQGPTSVHLYPGGGLSWLPLVTAIRRGVEAGANWEHPIVHSDTQRRLCLVARISIIRGDAADDPEWPAMRCARHFIF